MIVLDASALVDWLLRTPAGLRIEQRIYATPQTQIATLHTVHLLDLEFAQVLRRLVREGTLPARRAGEAIEDLAALRISRYAPVLLIDRIWRLRHNLSAYDAAYVALAEELKAPPDYPRPAACRSPRPCGRCRSLLILGVCSS